MRKKKFGKLLTVSLSENLYEAVKVLSEQYDASMGEVVRSMIQGSLESDQISSNDKALNTKNEKKISIDFNDYKETVDDAYLMGTEVKMEDEQ